MVCLTAHDISYIHTDREKLFEHLNFSVHDHDKVALIGNNGTGKSTLLNILSGSIKPTTGTVKSANIPYVVPQHVGQFNTCTVAGALQIQQKLGALQHILQGDTSNENLKILNEDWNIIERSREALDKWELQYISLDMKMEDLSGGEKTKVFLSGIGIHQPEIILLDEPTNHLDTHARRMLYDLINTFNHALVVVSHDRILLDMLNPVYELDHRGITVYGGNFAFYKQQKELERSALEEKLKEKEKELQVAKKTARKAQERKNKSDARGWKQHEGKVPRIAMKLMENRAEGSASKLKEIHSEKISGISGEIQNIRNELRDLEEMKVNFESAHLHKGKILATAEKMNFSYENHLLWDENLNFQIRSGERIVIKGPNGSGKTTLIKLIVGKLKPSSGILNRANFNTVYIDQEYSLIKNHLSIYEQAQQFNRGDLQEHEVKIRLNRFLFDKETWHKPCSTLSGGERMKLMLCCLMIENRAPDVFALDEPTNNLDIQNIEILTATLKTYQGTILVVSHDTYFLKEINTTREILLEENEIKIS